MISLLIAASSLQADDVEIYVTPPSEPIPPNVLLVLDTSGSMAIPVEPGMSRMDMVKAAALAIVNNPANDQVNLALMRFEHFTKVMKGFGLIADHRQELVDAINDLSPNGGTVITHPQAAAVLWFEQGYTPSTSDDQSYPSPLETDPIGNWCKKNYVAILSDGMPGAPTLEDVSDLNSTLSIPDQTVSMIGPYPAPPFIDPPEPEPLNGDATYRDQTCVADPNNPISGEKLERSDFLVNGQAWSILSRRYGGGHCAGEISRWARDADLRTGGEWDWPAEDTTHSEANRRRQNIVFHTIGVAFGADADPIPADDAERYLMYLANQSGGNYYRGNNLAQLSGVFQQIINDAMNSVAYTYSAPAIPFDQNNAAISGEDIYVPVYAPDVHSGWKGNVKKYRISYELSNPSDPSSTKIVVIRDKNNANAIDSDYLFISATDKWNQGAADGGDPLKGGAASNMAVSGTATRKLYTWLGGTADLTQPANRVAANNPAIDANKLGDLMLNGALSPLGNNFTARKQKLLNWLTWASDLVLPDGNGDVITISHKGDMGAPLHTTPVVVRDGGSEYVFIATTEGILHALDGDTGEEKWAFMPQELLPTIADSLVSDWNATKEHADDGTPVPADDHGHVTVPMYGLDGPTIVYTTDDGHRYLVQGMRRGGRNYYALDITNPLSPKMAWQIKGGSGLFSELGQTWSKPIFTKLEINGGSAQEVLIIGGGYDPNQDESYIDNNNNGIFDAGDTALGRDDIGDDSMGKAIFIVNPKTGTLITSITSTDLVRGSMGNAIASDILPVDINTNGITDRLYATDVGGRIIRVDIPDNALASITGNSNISATVVADVNDSSDTGQNGRDYQRFFNTPEVAYYNVGGQQYLALLIASGHRPGPLSHSVEHDRFYAIKDWNVWSAPFDGDGDGHPDYAEIVNESHLYDTTDNLIQDGTSSQKAAAQSALNAAKGWYINLADGEKGFSAAKVYDYAVMFTTYSGDRPAIVDPCDSGSTQGESHFYALNLTNGGATFAEMDGDSSTKNAGDRKRLLSIKGLPPAPTLMFPKAVDSSGAVNIGGEVVALVGLQEAVRWSDRFHPISWEEVISD